MPAVRERQNVLPPVGEVARAAREQGCGVVLLDARGRAITWNDTAAGLTGYDAHEVLGRPFACLSPAGQWDGSGGAGPLRLAAAEGRFVETARRVRKDGTEFWGRVEIVALTAAEAPAQDSAAAFLLTVRVCDPGGHGDRRDDDAVPAVGLARGVRFPDAATASPCASAGPESVGRVTQELRESLAVVRAAFEIWRLTAPDGGAAPSPCAEAALDRMASLLSGLSD